MFSNYLQIIATTGSSLLIALALAGCVSKNATRIQSASQDYQKLYAYHLNLAKRDFYDHAYKAAKLIYLERIRRPAAVERSLAMQAYEKIPKAALIIADSYYREHDYSHALQWYKKVDYSLYSPKDFKQLISIATLLNKSDIIEKLLAYAQKSDNPQLLTLLGKYYAKSDLHKALELFKQAATKYEPARIDLGLTYLKLKDKRGYEILKEYASKNAKAALAVADYLKAILDKEDRKLNRGCITLRFQTPYHFFHDKKYLKTYHTKFMFTNIVPLLQRAYELGEIRALYKLIRYDITDRTFFDEKTYSGFDLQGARSFLEAQNDLEAKLLLAKLYELYLTDDHPQALQFYKSYLKINEEQALWHIYQYKKRFDNVVDFNILKKLVAMQFTSAIIELAYQEAIDGIDIKKNHQTLLYYAKQDNILALNYLASLHSRRILLPKSKNLLYLKKACELEKHPFYIPSEDLKIANFYRDNQQNLKALSIYFYYAQLRNPKAQYALVRYYEKHNNKSPYFQKFAKDLKTFGDGKAKSYYYRLVLRGIIPDDPQEALDYLLHHPTAPNLLLLGDLFRDGIYVDIDEQRALAYYNQAIQKGAKNVSFHMAQLYLRYNIDNRYEKEIKDLIRHGDDQTLLLLARYYFHRDPQKTQRALRHIKNRRSPSYILLYYKFYGNYPIQPRNFIGESGLDLYFKAQKSLTSSPQKALYYAYRLLLCYGKQYSIDSIIVQAAKKINRARSIERIFEEAKKQGNCPLE